MGETLGAASASLNRGVPASHRISVCRGHIISRDPLATEVKEFYFCGLLESFESPGTRHSYGETGGDRLQARGYR